MAGWTISISTKRSSRCSPGDRVFLYSDGVPEAMDEELNEFGEERMVDVISQVESESLEDGVAKLCDSVETWCRPSGLKDDVSILGFEIPA